MSNIYPTASEFKDVREKVTARVIAGITEGRLSLDAAKRIVGREGRREGFIQGVLDAVPEAIRENLGDQIGVAMAAAPDERLAMKAAMRIVRTRRTNLTQEMAALERQATRYENHADALDELVSRFKSQDGLVMRGVSESQLHKVFQEGVVYDDEQPEPTDLAKARDGDATVFLIQHDWSALLENADVDDGGFRLPADLCCFEFYLCGCRVCLLITSTDGVPNTACQLLRTSHGWVYQGPHFIEDSVFKDGNAAAEIGSFMWKQVRAIAIMLDAEVIAADVVRAPYRLNAARERSGKLPIYDHHVLSIAHRTRGARLESDNKKSLAKRRLHFRRGHWRHYESHKTWIRWMLVGDPSLGFIDKDYRL